MEESEVSPQEYDCAPVIRTSSREELIESIKRGEAPTWVPNQALQALLAKENKPPVSQHEGTLQGPQLDEVKNTSQASQPQLPTSHQPSLQVPEEIERPRSALHSGDFHEKSASEENYQRSAAPSGPVESSFNIPTYPFPPWATPARMPKLPRFHSDTNTPDVQRKEDFTRARAPSLGSSLSSPIWYNVLEDVSISAKVADAVAINAPTATRRKSHVGAPIDFSANDRGSADIL